MGDTPFNPDRFLGLKSQRDANKAQTQATNLYQQATPGYEAVQSFGQRRIGQSESLLPSAFNAYSSASGLPLTMGGLPGTGGSLRQPPQASTANDGNPFQLSEPEQQQLNAIHDTYTRAHQNAMADLEARFTKAGITDPRALAAASEELGARLATARQAAAGEFAANAQQRRQQAALQEINLAMGLGQEGAGNVLAGAGGLSGQGNVQQQIAQQNQAASNAAFGNILNLVGFGLGGGFNQPKVPGIPGGRTPGGGTPPIVPLINVGPPGTYSNPFPFDNPYGGLNMGALPF